jgi:hypothetical protein
MIQTRYVKYGVISGLLLLCTIIVSTTEDSQRLAFAQITSAPAKTGESDDELSTNSSPDTGGFPITPSPNSETDGQDTSSSDEQDDSTDEW